MSKNLKEKLIEEFPGKMENEQAFVIQFIMIEAQKGNKPPSKDEIDNCIQEMIKDGTFEKKGPLLILKTTKPTITQLEEVEEEEENFPVVSASSIKGNFTENQRKILAAFQGTYEDRTAVVMNATITELSQGRKPPDKEALEKSIDELVENGTLELKGSLLIKK
ncbi:MAG: hypothetical protein JSW11_09555 [Candidatus Heimdallarchaeota archaeon]|nr:MAG: hypothetical protein JSW11_09555 [Candidatus Heimdallarchaeota archaeon]